MLYKETQHSLMDFLLQIMPDLKSVILVRPTVSRQAAKSLMSIWKNEGNKVSERRFKRPETLTTNDISEMESNGLIKSDGDFIDVTAKGVDVIKTMILGDERSSFEEGESLDYETALANTKPTRRTVRGAKSAIASKVHRSRNWYQRMKNGHDVDNDQPENDENNGKA